MAIVKTTMKDWGLKLPIGVVDANGVLVKDLELRPYITRIDRLLGLWIGANKDTYTEEQVIPVTVARLLSLAVMRVGEKRYTLSDDDFGSTEAFLDIMNWTFADVMYVYMYLRGLEEGWKVYSEVSCPYQGCNWKTAEAEFDYEEADVEAVDSVEDLSKWYNLVHPFKLRDDETICKKIKLGPMKWATMLQPGVMQGSLDTINVYALQDSIVSVNDKKHYRMTVDEVDLIRRKDKTRLDRLAEEVSGGVDLGLRLTCPCCGGLIVNPLNWEKEDFFGSSSPSLT